MQQILSNNWDFRIGSDRFVFEAPTQSEAFDFVRTECDRIACGLQVWGLRECLVFYPNCDRPIKIPVSIAKNNKEKPMKGLINEDWLRVAEEVLSQTHPTFLVSMIEHRNFIVNSEACKMMDCSEEKLLERNLAPLWTPPGEIKPIPYSVALPPHLEEFHKNLRQQSELINHDFCGWKPAGDDSDAIWVRWNDDIKLRVIDGHPFRLMICNGLEEVKPVLSK